MTGKLKIPMSIYYNEEYKKRGDALMKINEIIRQKRLRKGFTQEQVANYLGVSVPAVSKWETGVSYPDIVLLPALARLLDTDLNTLLSFQDNLSEKEVALFMNEVSEAVDKGGFEAGYSLAMAKIKEFPNCDLLIGNVAILLEGALMLSGKKVKKEYQEEIESLYRLAAKSSDVTIREQSQGILISKLIERGEYDQAQEILDTFSKESPVDRKQLQANLYIARGELEKAAQMTEEKLLSATNEIHACLMTLMEIAMKENRMEDAEEIADIDKQAAQLFDLWEYNSYVAHFQLYEATKNRMKSMKILVPMLKSLTKKWDINHSPLYRHIKKKEVDRAFGPKLQKAMIQSIRCDEETTYLTDSLEMKEFIKQMDTEQ